MGDNVLEIRELSKDYGDFVLDKVSFSLPRGVIMGLIGENGAGKSTTINCILNETQKTGGKILIFGKDHISDEIEIKDKLGVVFDENHFPDIFTAEEIGKFMSGIYSGWDWPLYRQHLEKFELPKDKKIKDFSKGMKVKLAFAVALSHKAELLILDDAIIGLCVTLLVNTISYFCFPAYQFGFYLFMSAASFCVVLLFLAFILPSNYWLGVNAGFAVMFILIILLVVLGIWSRVTDNAIIGFIVDNFDLSMIIGFVSTIVIFALSYILSITLFKRKYA
ncbi:MAG TPA: ATP-binding cassette domain-containing protein [Candidatus Fimimorpha faecalis]|uniref:ATP-binding cassette domain-containing protein n=1 Tax=Candidatus Fimimorpha faecalis TaxID=2840824 RepID=A0A9D1JES4_9FIRM|nr:ATP-binding cassette domain-containing protein [Candidatus Fimimorpha faecalis]